MASITAYVLKDDNSIAHTRTGDVESVLYAIEEEQVNYTIQHPPNQTEKWYWHNNQWNKEPRI